MIVANEQKRVSAGRVWAYGRANANPPFAAASLAALVVGGVAAKPAYADARTRTLRCPAPCSKVLPPCLKVHGRMAYSQDAKSIFSMVAACMLSLSLSLSRRSIASCLYLSHPSMSSLTSLLRVLSEVMLTFFLFIIDLYYWRK